MKSWFLPAALGLMLMLSACAAPDDPPTPRADHHVHPLSPTTAPLISKQIDAELGATGADDLIQLLDSARVEKATLLSLGYFFGMPEVDLSDERAKVRAENDYVADLAAQHSDRFIAFCSVNPLADYAADEIERCAQTEHLSGLKLHLANSDLDLRDSTEVQHLAETFAQANRLDLPIVIHLWTRHPDYGRTDAEIFIREVLPEAPDVPVQVAHLGGSGMFDDATEGALQAFAAAIDNETPVMDDVLFDLGAVTANPEAALAQGDTARAERYRRAHRNVAQWVQTLGPERVVFGSDYFARSVPDYVQTIRSLPLAGEIIQELLDNTAPYLQ